MAKVFGFDDSASEMEEYFQKANKARDAMYEVADDMLETAKEIFSQKSRMRTGKGLQGMVKEEKSDTVTIGWSARPGLHGYFHELGFHAVDNRMGRQRIPRTRRSRKRIYKRVRATYIPPRPHMRPAFDQHEQEFEDKVQNKIT